MNQVKIANDRIWHWAIMTSDASCIDNWLRANVGFGNWHEKIGVQLKPYRLFEFSKEEDAVLFALTWL